MVAEGELITKCGLGESIDAAQLNVSNHPDKLWILEACACSYEYTKNDVRKVELKLGTPDFKPILFLSPIYSSPSHSSTHALRNTSPPQTIPRSAKTSH